MRRWALDVGLAAAIAVISQLEIWAPDALLAPNQLPGPRAAVSAAYLIAALALVVRERFPLASVAVVCVSLGTEWISFGSPESFGSFILLTMPAYSVAAHADPRRAAAGLGLLLVAGAVRTLSDPVATSVSEHVASLVWLSPAIVVWLTGLYVRRHGLAEQRHLSALAGLEREERARAAVAEERARIARELHDAVGHSVSVMTVQTSAVRRLLTADQTRELQALTAVERTGREALAEMRRMVGVLRHPDEAPALAPPPGLDRLRSLIDQVRQAGLAVELRIEGHAAQLPTGLDLTAYRLVQEGLTNALKHARATQAEVLLRYEPDRIEIVVSDNGRADNPPTDGGHGLIGMRERVSVYQGELSAGPLERGGYELRARLPLTQP